MLVEIARKWVGVEFRHGQREQCMAFVRQVLAEAVHPMENYVTKKPVDKLPTGLLLASSLAGSDCGQVITSRSALQPDDIIFLANTYGTYPPGTITHVGIYSGEGKYIHRSTFLQPVKEAEVPFDLFRCGVRLNSSVRPKRQVKIFYNTLKDRHVLVLTEPLPAGEHEVRFMQGVYTIE